MCLSGLCECKCLELILQQICRSYVAAAYVKWIESAGGRAVPIRYCWLCSMAEAPSVSVVVMSNALLREGCIPPTMCSKLDSLLCRFYESEDEIHRLFRSINGVILPVGAVLCKSLVCTILIIPPHFCYLIVTTTNSLHSSILTHSAWSKQGPSAVQHLQLMMYGLAICSDARSNDAGWPDRSVAG